MRRAGTPRNTGFRRLKQRPFPRLIHRPGTPVAELPIDSALRGTRLPIRGRRVLGAPASGSELAESLLQ